MASKVALVTGANKGIGFAICKALAADPSFSVVVAAARDDVKGKDTVKQLNDLGYKNGMFFCLPSSLYA
jgi:NAD(P)-dependent dehydrogenase (short-subunit alcohol dehydrogenase family)